MEWIAAGLFSLLIGIVGLWTAIRNLTKRTEINQWKTTTGRVIERGVYQPDIPSMGPPAYNYAPLVRYEYTVDGKEFAGNTIHPACIQGPTRSTQKWARKKADEFPDELTIHYNETNPTEAYLVQTPARLLIIVATASTFMILVGLLILLARVVT